MAMTTEMTSVNAPRKSTGRAGWGITEALTRIATGFAALGESTHLARRAERLHQLNQLSDAQLASRGLRREDLAYRVFGPGAVL